jgi:hypothetical protein
MVEVRIELPVDVIEALGRERPQVVAREALVSGSGAQPPPRHEHQ